MSWSMVPLNVGKYIVYYMGDGRYAAYEGKFVKALGLDWAEVLTWLVMGPKYVKVGGKNG